MAVVAFWSEDKKETGQTLSIVALSTYMAIEHNYRILNISTEFDDKTLENCYWDLEQEGAVVRDLMGQSASTVGFESGVEGLIKLIRSNRTSGVAMSNYTKVVYNDRLDILRGPRTTQYNEYLNIASIYPEIINIARNSYDLVFVDISKKMKQEDVNKILEISDVIVVNITQKLSVINKFIKLKEQNRFFQNNNILINIGRCDTYSKYNIKNIARYLKMKRGVTCIPYNTLFFESCAEGRMGEFFWKYRNLDPDDRNYTFINHISNMSKDLIYKIQELQMRT